MYGKLTDISYMHMAADKCVCQPIKLA